MQSIGSSCAIREKLKKTSHKPARFRRAPKLLHKNLLLIKVIFDLLVKVLGFSNIGILRQGGQSSCSSVTMVNVKGTLARPITSLTIYAHIQESVPINAHLQRVKIAKLASLRSQILTSMLKLAIHTEIDQKTASVLSIHQKSKVLSIGGRLHVWEIPFLFRFGSYSWRHGLRTST